MLTHHRNDATKFKRNLKIENFQFLRILDARSAELKQITTANRLLFARDTSWSDIASVARYF